MKKYKYPRSYHLKYSEKSTSDDKIMTDDNHFIDKNVVVSIKFDGENTSIYNDHSHARSLDSIIDSEDRRWIENLRISKVEGKISNNMKICGENLFYKHTCKYDNLRSMFYVFSIWDSNKCLSWEETKKYCDNLGLEYVDIIFEGKYDKNLILEKFNNYINENNIDVEGFVVRISDEFEYDNFKFSLNKFVRKNFIIPDNHWRHSLKVKNKLINNLNPWNL